MAVTELPDLSVRLCIASTPAHLPVVRSAVETLCAMMGFDETSRGEIVLAVDESLTNIIRHAYHGAADKPIEITLRPTTDAAGGSLLRIELRDWGERVAPEQIRSRDLRELRPGGLGVHIMNQCMDEVRYDPAPEGGTRLTMVKKLS